MAAKDKSPKPIFMRWWFCITIVLLMTGISGCQRRPEETHRKSFDSANSAPPLSQTENSKSDVVIEDDLEDSIKAALSNTYSESQISLISLENRNIEARIKLDDLSSAARPDDWDTYIERAENACLEASEATDGACNNFAIRIMAADSKPALNVLNGEVTYDIFLNWEEKQNSDGAGFGTASSGTEQSYILNTNTKKFHSPTCSSAEDISSKNRQSYYGTRDVLISRGYSACSRCNP